MTPARRKFRKQIAKHVITSSESSAAEDLIEPDVSKPTDK